MRRLLVILAVTAATAVVFAPTPAAAKSDPSRDVFAAESSFAATMAARDHEAFGTFLAEEGIFYGRRGAIRGKKAIMEAWAPLFEGAAAPFSWRPDGADVLESGSLAMTSGPVHDPSGKLIGRFNSIWRLEKDGKWRVIFDKGCDVCEPAKAE